MSTVHYGYEQQRHTIQLPNALIASYMTKYIQSRSSQAISVSYAQVISKKIDFSVLMKHATVVSRYLLTHLIIYLLTHLTIYLLTHLVARQVVLLSSRVTGSHRQMPRLCMTTCWVWLTR